MFVDFASGEQEISFKLPDDIDCSGFVVILIKCNFPLGENANKYFPFYIMAALLIATTFIVLLLPETRNSSLPESLEDAIYLENFKLFFLRPKGKVKSSTSGKIQSKGAPLIVQ